MGELHREAAAFEDVLPLSSAGVYWAPLAADKHGRSVKLLAARECVNTVFKEEFTQSFWTLMHSGYVISQK